MNQTKYESEAEILRSFIKIYCDGQEHQNKEIKGFTCKGIEATFAIEERLCQECQTLLQYSLERLQACPYEEKPRCRKCPHPCYEKKAWKSLAKIMRYSGLKLGVLKVKKMINIFLLQR